MGRDKAGLEFGGQTLLARQIELARFIGASEVFIAGRTDADYSEFDCRVLPDRFQNAGPLAGIESALAATPAPLLLVLAVDMPEMSAAFLKILSSACTADSGAIPQLGGRIEPLAAFYPKAAFVLAEEMLELSRTSRENRAPGPTDFARECVGKNLAKLVAVAATEARCFTNLNSPEDCRAKNDSML